MFRVFPLALQHVEGCWELGKVRGTRGTRVYVRYGGLRARLEAEAEAALATVWDPDRRGLTVALVRPYVTSPTFTLSAGSSQAPVYCRHRR
jgi:hypothetical protein